MQTIEGNFSETGEEKNHNFRCDLYELSPGVKIGVFSIPGMQKSDFYIHVKAPESIREKVEHSIERLGDSLHVNSTTLQPNKGEFKTWLETNDWSAHRLKVYLSDKKVEDLDADVHPEYRQQVENAPKFRAALEDMERGKYPELFDKELIGKINKAKPVKKVAFAAQEDGAQITNHLGATFTKSTLCSTITAIIKDKSPDIDSTQRGILAAAITSKLLQQQAQKVVRQ